MKISRGELNNLVRTYVEKPRDAGLQSPVAMRAGGGGKDRVTYSPKAQEMRRLQELLERVPDVREELVAPIKERLANGTYDVNGDLVATQIVSRLLGDKLA